jgi:hypothetical protein
VFTVFRATVPVRGSCGPAGAGSQSSFAP